MGFRDKMRRLENAARDNLASFELVDGSCFYYELASPELFLHICDCLTNHDKPKRPKPPEMVKALARAKDRRAAFSQIGEGETWGCSLTRWRPSWSEGRLSLALSWSDTSLASLYPTSRSSLREPRR